MIHLKILNLISSPIVRHNIEEQKVGFVGTYQTPLMEKGAYKIVSRVFPQFKDKISSNIDITRETIMKSNVESLGIVQADKKVDETLQPELLKTTYLLAKLTVRGKMKHSTIKDSYGQLKQNTSSCYPNFKKKGNPEEIKFSHNLMRRFLSFNTLKRSVNLLFDYPCVIFNRTTSSLKKKRDKYVVNYKIRQVYGVPAFICGLENFFFKDTIKAFFNTFSIYHTVGLTRLEVSKRLKDFRSKAKSSNKYILCGDLSKCDLSISEFSLLNIFTYLIGLSGNNNLHHKIALCKYHMTTPILYDKKVVYSKGVNTSGSQLTTFVNTFTLINAFFTYLRIHKNRLPHVNDFIVQGDDFIMQLDTPEEVKEVKQFLRSINLRLKVFSTDVIEKDEDITFLGFKWDSKSEPYNDPEWIASKTIFPERFSRDFTEDRIIVRYLSIIILLRNFRVLFNKFLLYDPVLRSKFLMKNYHFNIFKFSRYYDTQYLPIDTMLQYGWRMT